MRVVWTVDVEAATPREAAQKALEMQRDPDSLATVFDVVYGDSETPVDWRHFGTIPEATRVDLTHGTSMVIARKDVGA